MLFFFFSSRRRHTICALVTGVQTCALPICRPYTMQRRSKLGLSVLALASLSEPALLQPEADLWTLAGEALGDDGVLDLGVPKPCAEFLVSGSAYTVHQPERHACVARVRVGDRQKSLMVQGDRYWLDRSEEHTSELQSLMRISYAVFCLKKKNRSKTD